MEDCVAGCNANESYPEPVPVGSLALCSRPSANGAKIYDLSGNVAEWTGACTAAGLQARSCVVRGGSWDSVTAEVECSAGTKLAQRALLPSVGFRCCWDPGL